MKNTLSDLNNHLFAQLERLGEEDLDEDEIKKEVQRSKAITDVAKVIVDNGRLIKNLEIVSNDEMLEMNRKGLRYDDPEFTKTGILIAKVNRSAAKLQKGKENGEKI